MNTRTLIASLLFAALAAPAMANTDKTDESAKPAAATAAAAAPAAPAEADRKICKNEKPVGSQIPKRICKTAAEWEADREAARKMMQDMQQRTGTTYGR